MPNQQRPARLRIRAENGQLQSVPDEPQSYVLLRPGRGSRCVVFLGLGANPQAAAQAAAALLNIASAEFLLPGGWSVQWLEAPDFFRQVSEEAPKENPPGESPAAQPIPAHWQRLSSLAGGNFPPDAALIFYQPGLRLFPSFWGPVLGEVRAAALRDSAAQKKPSPCSCGSSGNASGDVSGGLPGVILPGGEDSLLTRELADAFAGHGCAVHSVAPEELSVALPRLLEQTDNARLAFCVNARGLDSHGEVFHTLSALGVAVHIWFVDTPWHVLSAFRAPWWKQAALWVTDDSFIEPLRRCGASKVRHLPLAASPCFSRPEAYESALPGASPAPLAPIVFAGRSAFPDKAAFFAGQRVPAALLARARDMLENSAGGGSLPDFAWWSQQLGVAPWPGHEVRAAGLGAEECNRLWRAQCLNALGPSEFNLTIFGDDGWRELLPARADIRPPVDYYATLPSIYATARYSLNVTSLLLPHGLTQRNFDIWTAGGFCLSSRTPGLNIFPREITGPTSFENPAEIPHLLQRLERDKSLRADLIAAWQAELAARHTYAHRTQHILESL